MVFTSKTGLFPVVNKKHNTHRSSESLDLKCTVTPAPLALRPLASLYNPFSPSCSILCNHPTIVDTKKVVKQTKYSVSESKFFEKYACLHCEGYGEDTRPIQDLIYTEEIFRRYTDTDSRPMTPALTLASGKSRGSRRCLTPDDPPKRTSLVVDLRKSHSQETLYYHGCDSNETSNLGNSTVEAISMPPLCIPMLTVNDKRELLPPLASPIILSRRSTNVSDKDFKTQKGSSHICSGPNSTKLLT